MHKSKYIILILTLLVSTFTISSCHTFISQETEPKNFKYFKILASTDDDSVFINVQDEMHIQPRVSSFVLIVNVLDEDPNDPYYHYVVFGEETDATRVLDNFYSLSKKTREKLLNWSALNKSDLKDGEHYDGGNQWYSKEREEMRQKKELEIYSKEISDYKKALEHNPNNSDLLTNIAQAYNACGDIYERYFNEYSKAESEYTEAIEINPNYFESYISRGDLYRYIFKEYSKAIYDYKMVMKLEPNNADIYSKIIDCYHNQGESYYKTGKYSKAIYEYQMVMKLDSNKTLQDHIYNRLGLCYINLDEYSKAISYYDKLLEISPNYMFAYLNRGIAYCEIKNMSKGCDDLRKADKLGIPGAKKMLDKYCK